MKKVTINWGRKKEEPEKAVLPTIIFIHLKKDYGEGFAIALGWWDYSIQINLLFINSKEKQS